MQTCEKCKKTKVRAQDEYKSLLNRLSRIEGQVKGVRGMVMENAYCVDILTQVSAISSALTAFSKELLENHLRTCVVSDIKSGCDGAVDELISVVNRMIK